MPRAARCVLALGLFFLLILTLADTASSNNQKAKRRKRRLLRGDGDSETAAVAGTVPRSAAIDDFAALALQGCGRLFLDGGSNTGESVRGFLKGGFFTCGLHSPSRQYSSAWNQLSRGQKVEAMRPLKEPSTFCVRSFEAAPELMPQLRKQEEELRAQQLDVRFVEAALGNATSSAAPRTVVRYARNPWGVSATGLKFEHAHVGGKPVPLESRTLLGQSYELRGVVQRALALNSSSVIAIKLDIEGSEYWALEALVADPELLCKVSYLFTEFHSTASADQRVVLQGYGLREDAFEHLKSRAHAAMERPGCKLKVYWRSFWASCGDKQRFEWRTSAQASQPTDSLEVPA